MALGLSKLPKVKSSCSISSSAALGCAKRHAREANNKLKAEGEWGNIKWLKSVDK